MVRFRIVALAAAVAAVLLAAGPSPASAAGPAARRGSVAGGDTLVSAAGARCVLGFNTTGRGILTTARCGPVGTRWYAGSVSVGVTSTVLVGRDAALITIDNPLVGQLHGVRGPGGLVDVSAAARAYVGPGSRIPE